MPHIPTPEEIERLIIERATTDPDFRARLLADPRGTLQSDFFSDPIPEQIRITVLEQAPDEAMIVLPSAVGGDVTDSELAGAAFGGWDPGGGTSPGCNVQSCQYSCT
ncbi:MAG: NHLP leader peptide family natural product precursor [Actinomycetota bacterium]